METYEIDGFAFYEFKPQNQIEHTKIKQKHVFFSHANGIPAKTYQSFLTNLANRLGAVVVAYDMRGMGRTKVLYDQEKKQWPWSVLVQDHVCLFEKIKQTKPSDAQWFFAGHSLGAWVSLLAAEKTNVIDIWLFDPPILSWQVALPWSLMCLLKRRHANPNGQKVRKRKTSYPSFDKAYESLSKSSFSKNWPAHVLKDYIDASFVAKGSNVILRHDPNWEACLFDSYPIFPAAGFLKIPKKIRKKLKLTFFVGSCSQVCQPKAKNWLKLFFPNFKWVILQNMGHLFPLEQQEETISVVTDFV